MTNQQEKEVSRFVSIFIVLWPAILWACGYVVAQIARWNGCKILARGPEECILFGADFGELIYPLWSLGFYLLFVFLWVPFGIIILGIVRYTYRNSD